MSDMEVQQAESQVTLSKATMIYGMSVVGFIIAVVISAMSNSLWLFLLAYIGIGIFLSRKIINGMLSWHPVWATIDNIFSYKVKMIALWPITYPFLFAKIAVIKHL